VHWIENKFNTITFKQVRFLLDILLEMLFFCLFSFKKEAPRLIFLFLKKNCKPFGVENKLL